jgi:predicted esterase
MNKLHPEWISNKKLEILLGNGEYDPPALQKLGKIYADLLKKKQISVEFKIFNDDDHFSVLDNLSRVNSEIANTFKSFLLRADERRKMAKL